MRREIYSETLNILYQVRSSGYWYCFCNKFDGCTIGRFTSETLNFSVCKIDYDFSTDVTQKIKYKPKELIFYVSKLLDEMKVAVSINKKVHDLWYDEYYFKWQDWQSGTEGGIGLFELIDF